MNAKHTPGPFYAAFGLDSQAGTYGTIGILRDGKCGPSFADIRADFDNFTPKQLEGFGCLIAAAPELYAALHTLLASLDETGTYNGAAYAARAALRKADGEAV
jgi:hypothetical protein